jgi:transcriptional regulator with XRE-family HTH domain
VTEALGSGDTAARKAEYQRALAAFIRHRRMGLRLTQTQLAERVGWSQERISNLESGKYGLPTILALSRLATMTMKTPLLCCTRFSAFWRLRQHR